MSTKDTGGPYFPESDTSYGGATLRDEFAKAAMQGYTTAIMSSKAIIELVGDMAFKQGLKVDEYVAKHSYGLADAMLKERAK